MNTIMMLVGSLSLLIGVFIFGLVILATSKAKRLLCVIKHDWRVITTVHLKLQDDQGIRPKTRIVLQCCQCGDIKEKLLKVSVHIPGTHFNRFTENKPVTSAVVKGKPNLTLIKKD